MVKLGVNIDHVATIRQARGTTYPDLLQAALAAERGGALGITIHLREDRRHIQDRDVAVLRSGITTKLNLEMACVDEMVDIAIEAQPQDVCLVPEKREELTTEGGLDVTGQQSSISQAVASLKQAGICVSLFVDPDLEQIQASLDAGADAVEVHTGTYADATDPSMQHAELGRVITASKYAVERGLIVNAGHGLTLANVEPIAATPSMNELNIGHSLVADAVFVGIEEAVRRMVLQIQKVCSYSLGMEN